MGFGLTAVQHGVLLAVAVATSFTISSWRSWKTKRLWPMAISAAGSSLVLLGHFRGELHVVEWGGVMLLLGGGLIEHIRLRRLRSASSRPRFERFARYPE